MFKLVLKDKQGFQLANRNDGAKLKIYDEKGNIFYMLPFNSFANSFNLPSGIFFSNVKLVFTPFKKYYLPLLPKRNSYTTPKKFKFQYDYNPNKCTIDLRTGKVLFDIDFYNSLSRVQRAFVIMHEKGHYYYRGQGNTSEINCDLYACKKLLEAGFNPSQIAIAHKKSLTASNKAKQRINKVFETIREQ